MSWSGELGMVKAPRIEAYVKKLEGRTVLEMKRNDWKRLNIDSTAPVRLNVRDTPMASVAQTSSLLACTAHRMASGLPIVNIYRDDPKDASTPINKDTYSVIEDITQRSDFGDIVRAASTQDDPNLRQYLSERVYLVKQNPGTDHWLPVLPDDVSILISSA
jgi:hypothetical protein